MIKVAVFGAKGRMGTAVCQAVEEAEDTELVAAVDSGGDRSDASGADVIVDFTTPDAVMDNLSWAISHDINTVSARLGLTMSGIRFCATSSPTIRISAAWWPRTFLSALSS